MEHGFVYGLDPASKNDYFGITIHQLPKFVAPGVCYYCDLMTVQNGYCADCGKKQPPAINMPKLITLRDLTGLNSYKEALAVLEDDLFPRLPPTYIVADYTNEKTFTDLLRGDYGDERVERINFTIPSKTMLKEDGLSIMKMGYEFPDPRAIENPIIKKRVMNLIDQLLHEQVITTKSGKITFDHEPGKHNDLAISWELSIRGCLKFILRHITPGAAAVAVQTTDAMMQPNRKKILQTKDLLHDLLLDGNNKLTSTSTYGM